MKLEKVNYQVKAWETRLEKNTAYRGLGQQLSVESMDKDYVLRWDLYHSNPGNESIVLRLSGEKELVFSMARELLRGQVFDHHTVASKNIEKKNPNRAEYEIHIHLEPCGLEQLTRLFHYLEVTTGYEHDQSQLNKMLEGIAREIVVRPRFALDVNGDGEVRHIQLSGILSEAASAAGERRNNPIVIEYYDCGNQHELITKEEIQASDERAKRREIETAVAAATSFAGLFASSVSGIRGRIAGASAAILDYAGHKPT